MTAARAPSVQPAYVLHQHDWSESSLILDLFTRESGRVAVAAKGAKRPYSQLRAVLLPLQRIAVSLSKPAKADGGEVLVSKAVRDALSASASCADITFDSGRVAELKGFTGDHRLYAVGWLPPDSASR